MLKGARIAIGMDGKGAWRDKVFVERLWRTIKYEEVYLHVYATVSEARTSMGGNCSAMAADRSSQSRQWHKQRENPLAKTPGAVQTIRAISVGCTPNRLTNPLTVSSLFNASNATFALKYG